MALVVGAGSPILIIMPLLIFLPRLLWHVRDNACVRGIFGALGTKEQHQRLQRFSAYWMERFLFSFMLWVQFISFIAASTAINATPTPGTACDFENAFRSMVADEEALCYTSYLGGTHLLGTIVTVALCMVFPYFMWWKCRQVNYLNLEEDERELVRYGMIWDQFSGGWKRYYCLVDFFLMNVLISTFSLWQQTDAAGLAISCIVLCSMMILGYLLLGPSQDRRDDFIESYYPAVQIVSLVFPFVGPAGANYPMNTEVSGRL